jgi:ribosomal-protein-serine acetyltransferase
MEPLLVGEICLRPFEARDVAAFGEAARESHASVGRWMSWCRSDYASADAEAWFALAHKNLQQGVSYELGIFTSDGTTLLGGVGLNQFNRAHNFCNLGYWVRESRQGQGIATRASRALAEFGFRELKLGRIEIVVAQGNFPSQRVAQKVGAAFECVARNRLVVNRCSVAAAVYSLVPNADSIGG